MFVDLIFERLKTNCNELSVLVVSEHNSVNSVKEEKLYFVSSHTCTAVHNSYMQLTNDKFWRGSMQITWFKAVTELRGFSLTF
jgi:hypothetical protein